MDIEKIRHFKINSEFDFIFGYETNYWKTISDEEKEEWKETEVYRATQYEFNAFKAMGILEYIEEPEVGDRCYFWNISDEKMNSTVDGKPFIGIFEKKQGNRYVVKDCPMVFKYAEKVKTDDI